MKRKRLFSLLGSICLVLALVVLLLPACAKEAPAPAVPTPTPTPTVPTPTPTPEEPITLKIAMWSPPPVAFSKGQVWTWEELEKRSDGRIKVEPYYSGSLLPGKEMPEGLEAGIAQIACINPAYYMGKFPLSSVNSLPMLMLDQWTTGKSMRDLYEEFPEIREEFARFNSMLIVSLGGSYPYGVFTKEPVATYEDLKGMRIRAHGAQGLLMDHFGAVPVSMVATEAYTALERGTLDGICANFSFGVPYGYTEVCKYFFRCHLGTTSHLQAMNLDTWNSLPKDIQQMIRDLEPEQWIYQENIFFDDEDSLMKKAVEEHGLTITEVGREDLLAALTLCSEELWGKWAAGAQARGLPGFTVLGRYIELTEQNRKLRPAELKATFVSPF